MHLVIWFPPVNKFAMYLYVCILYDKWCRALNIIISTLVVCAKDANWTLDFMYLFIVMPKLLILLLYLSSKCKNWAEVLSSGLSFPDWNTTVMHHRSFYCFSIDFSFFMQNRWGGPFVFCPPTACYWLSLVWVVVRRFAICSGRPI